MWARVVCILYVGRDFVLIRVVETEGKGRGRHL